MAFDKSQRAQGPGAAAPTPGPGRIGPQRQRLCRRLRQHMPAGPGTAQIAPGRGTQPLQAYSTGGQPPAPQTHDTETEDNRDD